MRFHHQWKLSVRSKFRKPGPALHHMHFPDAWSLGEALSTEFSTGSLENMQKILLANSMYEGLGTEAKQSARIDLIRLVVTSATQPDISSSNPQKTNKSAS